MTDDIKLIELPKRAKDRTGDRPWLDRLDGDPVDPLTKSLIAATVNAGLSETTVARMFNATMREVHDIMGHAPDQAGNRIN